MKRIPRGFTLVELLAVIAIIALLSSIVTVGLSSAKQKSRDSKRIGDIKTIQVALANYYANNGFYPLNIYASSNAGGAGSITPANGLAPAYMAVVPTDPGAGTTNSCNSTGANGATTACYRYNAYTASGNALCNTTNNIPMLYHIGAALEDTSNSYLSATQNANLAAGGSSASVSFNGVTFTKCQTGSAPSSQFDGNATACVGLSAVSPDTCYDLTP